MHITSILIICGSLSLFDLVVNNNDADRTYRATNRRKHDPSKKNHAKGSKSYQTYKPPLRSFICTTGRGQCTHCYGTVRNFRVFQDFPTSCAFDVRYRHVSRAPLWPTGTGMFWTTDRQCGRSVSFWYRCGSGSRIWKNSLRIRIQAKTIRIRIQQKRTKLTFCS